MIFHSKNILCCDFSSEKPWSLVTGSEDQAVAFYKGPPFKKGVKISQHEGFVQSVRFSPNNEFFVSVSSDKTI